MDVESAGTNQPKPTRQHGTPFLQAATNMQQFMRSNALSPMVMVCTDRSSRGMDFDRAEVRVDNIPVQAPSAVGRPFVGTPA